ncbi:MAG: AmmeMemoRadiSam system protein B [Anaerolineales bacterium]|nr:AmmeMemoRadiSam system protein B [Anaerolineales bacterium]HUS83687.1 AmmeMemoRadiSam system protein B [Anaerolineales bacterium]
MNKNETPVDIRPSPIAGTWYPGSAETLAQSIDQYLSAATIHPLDGDVIGIIAPHAGHRYSGQVAAYAFRHLENLTPETVAVISPLHVPAQGRVFTSGHDAYTTPLGVIPVDSESRNRFQEELERNYGIEPVQLRNDSEHSLEIELPFLQRVFDYPFRLLPIMLRDQGLDAAMAVGHTLGRILKGTRGVIIASSDLSHFYPESVAKRLDSEILARIEAFDPQGVLAAEEEGTGFACGRGAIAAALWATQDLGADKAKIVQHATSGDVTMDFDSVVGYGAAVMYR